MSIIPRRYLPFRYRFYGAYPYYLNDPLWLVNDDFHYSLRWENARLRRELSRVRSRSVSPPRSVSKVGTVRSTTPIDDAPVSRVTRSAYTTPVAIPVAPCNHAPLSRRSPPNYLPPRATARSPAPLVSSRRSALKSMVNQQSAVDYNGAQFMDNFSGKSRQCNSSKNTELLGEAVKLEEHQNSAVNGIPYRRTIKGHVPWLENSTEENDNKSKSPTNELDDEVKSWFQGMDQNTPFGGEVNSPVMDVAHSPWMKPNIKKEEVKNASEMKMSKSETTEKMDVSKSSVFATLKSSFKENDAKVTKKASRATGQFAKPMTSLMKPNLSRYTALDDYFAHDDQLHCAPMHYAAFDYRRSIDHLKFTMGVY